MTQRINTAKIGLLGLTLFTLVSWVFVSFLQTIILQILIVAACLFLVALGGRISVDFLGILWLLSASATVASLGNSIISTTVISGPLIFSLGVLVIIFARNQEVGTFKAMLTLIKWAAVFYSLSVLFSFICPGLHERLFVSRLPLSYQLRALKVAKAKTYLGFSSDIAFTAGYVLNGIGIIICHYMGNPKGKLEKWLLILLTVGLFLTQKRAHILCLCCALVVVAYFAGKIKLTPKRVFSFLGIVVLVIVLVLAVIGSSREFSNRFLVTIDRLFQGEDITSNRTQLYDFARELFKSKPLFGIGWGNYRERSIGNVTINTKMYPHNMYLQLLAETGAVGTIIILLPFFLTFFKTAGTVKGVFRTRKECLGEWGPILLFSLFYQSFFLLYGLFENTLHNYNFLLLYFFACGFYLAFAYNAKRVSLGVNTLS